MPVSRMVRVTSVGDPIEARIIAARLGSEGLLWELRGGVHPYPVGPVHIYVEEHELGVATDIINLSSEPPDDGDAVDADSTRAPLALWVVVLAVVAVAVFGILRIGVGAGMGTRTPTTVPLPSGLDTSP